MDDAQLKYWYGQGKLKVWRCEEPLKALCATFDLLWPHNTPSGGNRASWYAGLRKIQREFGEGESVKFIQWAKDELDKRNKHRQRQGQGPLTLVDAHSIFFLVPHYKSLKAGAGETCPDCGQGPATCRHEWGSRKRTERYGGQR